MPHSFQNIGFETQEQSPARLDAAAGPYTFGSGMELRLVVDGTEVVLALNAADTTAADVVATLTPQSSLVTFSDVSGALRIETTSQGSESLLSVLTTSGSTALNLPLQAAGVTAVGVPEGWTEGGQTLFQPLQMTNNSWELVETFNEGWDPFASEEPFEFFTPLVFTISGVTDQEVETFKGHTPTTLGHFNPLQPFTDLVFGSSDPVCTFDLPSPESSSDLQFGSGDPVCSFEITDGPLGFINMQFETGENPFTASTEKFNFRAPGHVLIDGDLTEVYVDNNVILTFDYELGGITNTVVYQVAESSLSGSLANRTRGALGQLAEIINNDQSIGFFFAEYVSGEDKTPTGLWITCKVAGMEYTVRANPCFSSASRYPSPLASQTSTGWWWYTDNIVDFPHNIAGDPLPDR